MMYLYETILNEFGFSNHIAGKMKTISLRLMCVCIESDIVVFDTNGMCYLKLNLT